MAEYGRIGQASDYRDEEYWVKPNQTTRTSRVQKKLTKTYSFDFGSAPYTVEDFREFAKEIEELPPEAKVNIQYYDSQRDGTTFKVTISV